MKHPSTNNPKIIQKILLITLLTTLIPVLTTGQNLNTNITNINFSNLESKTTAYFSQYQKQSGLDNSIGRLGLLINPVGILQFGPIIQFEIRLGSGSIIGPHVRFSGFGLLTHVANDYDETSLGSMALGFGFKQLIGPSSIRHKFYVGAITEFGWGSGTSEEWDYWEGGDVDAEYQHKYISLVANSGYRWRFQSGMFMNLGAFAGVAIEIEDIRSYPSREEYDNEILFLGMIEFSFGWEF